MYDRIACDGSGQSSTALGFTFHLGLMFLRTHGSQFQPDICRGQEEIPFPPTVFWDLKQTKTNPPSSETSGIVTAGDRSEVAPGILPLRWLAGLFLLTCSGSN